jgi:hypothetical protein
MDFLKQNRVFFSVFVLCLVLFSFLQIVSCNSAENIELVISSINTETQRATSLEEELLLFEGLEKESEAAILDLVILSETEKDQHRFWNNIINSNQNISSSWKKKSPESINADITRLYSHLNDLCKTNNIFFHQDEINNVNIFDTNKEKEEQQYGFGLSSYDGFWPNFSKEEAQLLGIQSKIITSLIDFLTESSNSEHKIFLVQILRESVGNEDSQHIGNDLLSIQNIRDKLVRFDGGIKTFSFQIKFKSHTAHARSFINQLIPPFLLRDLIVSRSDELTSPNLDQVAPDPFSGENEITKQSLPIVQNVESTFTLLVEYVYEIDRDFESFIAFLIKEEEVDKEILTEFLESSGNSKIRSKIEKKLTNREVP